ncbi:MAG: transcriptional regulator NrdR [Spirochaetia bacterium]|jgi:transcriptional repressor NrdR|nr:transcriptional repressor NrdR [Spirochaetales bacterium]
MRCPFCRHPKTRVVDKRNLEERDTIRRRRECLSCKRRFSTYERIEWTGVSVIKKDGRRESFDRNKLRAGVLKACEKRPIPSEEIEKRISGIEAELYNYGSREVPARVIGELVMDRLKALDKVAYIRFASVYREFTDLKSFEKELRTLKKN